jgi:hypothetical protein
LALSSRRSASAVPSQAAPNLCTRVRTRTPALSLA